jgi:hypothetical protein
MSDWLKPRYCTDAEWRAYLVIWRRQVDADATEYVYWHGKVPDWWLCDADGVKRS